MQWHYTHKLMPLEVQTMWCTKFDAFFTKVYKIIIFMCYTLYYKRVIAAIAFGDALCSKLLQQCNAIYTYNNEGACMG